MEIQKVRNSIIVSDLCLHIDTVIKLTYVVWNNSTAFCVQINDKVTYHDCLATALNYVVSHVELTEDEQYSLINALE